MQNVEKVCESLLNIEKEWESMLCLMLRKCAKCWDGMINYA